MEEVPAVVLEEDAFREDAIDIVSLLVSAKLVPTRNEGRRAVEQGGVSVNEEKITDPKKSFTKEELKGEGLLVRRGKKNFKKVKF